MPELIAKQTGKELSSELRKKFLEVLHIKEAGRIAIYGVDKKTKKKKQIGWKKYLESSGHKPEPQRAQGIWRSGGGDIPVVITGTYGDNRAGVELLRAYSTKTKIPRDKVEWLGNNGNQAKDKDNELHKTVSDLSVRLEKMERQMSQLQAKNKKLAAKNSKLKAKNRQLKAQMVMMSTDEPPSDVEVNNRTSDSRTRRYLNTSTGWIGSKMPWRPQPHYTDRRIEERDSGPVVVANEERIDGYTAEDRRRGSAAVLIGAVALGLGILAAGIWGEHEENEGRSSVPPAKITQVQPHVHQADNTTGRHELLFHGSEAFKVSLPANLDAEENADGSYRIDDTADHVIVPHVRWDEQGNADKDTKQLLKTDPYEELTLKQVQYDYHTPGTNFDHHYMTVVENE